MRSILVLALTLCTLAPSRAETRFAPLDLSAVFDNDAVATKDMPGDGNFDGIGTTQPATFNFSEEGWPKEAEPRLAGIPFRLGSIQAGAKNNVIASGQAVPLPAGRYSALYVLAAATNGSYGGTWTLTYAEGAAHATTLRVSDWCVGPGPGEATAIRSAYRYFAGGGPSPDCAPQVYLQRIDLDSNRTLVSITLPVQANTHIFGLTLGAGDRITPSGLPPLKEAEDTGPRVTITGNGPHGALIVPPGPVRLSVVADRLGASRAEIVVRVIDATGFEVARGEASADWTNQVSASPLRLSVPHDTLAAGYYYVEARLKVNGSEQVFRSGLAVVPDDLRAESKPDSPFGMNEGLDQDDPERAKAVAWLLRRAGVRWVRQGFDWGRIEPEPGRWAWDSFDRALTAAQGEKLMTMGLLAYWAGWSKPFTPEGYAAYADYAARVATRYKQVPAWEVWNEPNIFYWKGTRDQYATLLKAATGAIHKANPKAAIVGIDTAFSDVPFIRGVLESGARPDIVSVHPYRGAAPDVPIKQSAFDGGKDMVTMSQETRRVLRAIQETAGNLPLWFTEIGWWTDEPGGGLTGQTQADYLARTYALSLAEGVEKVFWYAFIDAGTKPGYDQHHFGILRPDLSPKPAFVAYATIARRLEGFSFDRRLVLAGNVQALRFRREPDTVTVLWATDGEAKVDLPVTGDGVRVVLWDGREEATIILDNRLSLTLSGSPLYVIERD